MSTPNTAKTIFQNIPLAGGITISDLRKKVPYSARTIHYHLDLFLGLEIVTKQKKLMEDQRKWFYIRTIKEETLALRQHEITTRYPGYSIVWDFKILYLLHVKCQRRIKVGHYKEGYRTPSLIYHDNARRVIKRHTCFKLNHNGELVK